MPIMPWISAISFYLLFSELRLFWSCPADVPVARVQSAWLSLMQILNTWHTCPWAGSTCASDQWVRWCRSKRQNRSSNWSDWSGSGTNPAAQWFLRWDGLPAIFEYHHTNLKMSQWKIVILNVEIRLNLHPSEDLFLASPRLFSAQE